MNTILDALFSLFDSLLSIKGKVLCFVRLYVRLFTLKSEISQKQAQVLQKRVTKAQLYTYCTSHSSLSSEAWLGAAAED